MQKVGVTVFSCKKLGLRTFVNITNRWGDRQNRTKSWGYRGQYLTKNEGYRKTAQMHLQKEGVTDEFMQKVGGAVIKMIRKVGVTEKRVRYVS